MRASASFRLLALLIPASALISLGCGGSNDVTSPTMATGADVSGNWNGQYQSDAPAVCTSGTATAAFVQTGNRVDGPFKALACGVDGTFHGRISGNTLTGSVGMLGCTGGTVTGHLDNGALSLTITDFRKDLIAGEVEVLPGGQVSMQR